MLCLGSCRLWSPRSLRITPPSTDFFDPTLLGDETMHFMLPLGQIVDVRQYLASHMRNRERYLKRASMLHPELARLAHCTDRKSQTGSIIITVHYSAGSVRCAAHACQTSLQKCRRADHQSTPSVPPPCQQQAIVQIIRQAPRLYSAAQLPNGQSLLPKQGSRSSNNERPVAQTSAVAVSIASLVPLDTRNSMAALLARRHLPKKKRKGRRNRPQDDDTFRCYHGCLIV